MKKLIVLLSLILGLSIGSVWAMEGDPIDKSGGDDRGMPVARDESPTSVMSLNDFSEKINMNVTKEDLVDFFELKSQFRNIAKERGSYGSISFEEYPTDQLKKIVRLTEEFSKEKLSRPSSFEESHLGAMHIYCDLEVEKR